MSTTYTEMENGGLLCSKEAGGLGVLDLMEVEESSPIVVFVSDQNPDHDGDVVFQRANDKGPGWVLDHFNNLPVLSWLHDLRRPNISAKDTHGRVGDHPSKGVGLFLDPLALDPGDYFAMDLDGKMRREVPLEFSVGFKAKKEHAEPRAVDGQRVGWNFYGQTLQEVAIANRGANPRTEVMSKMLEDSDTASRVQAAGDPEVLELKEALADLAARYKVMADVLKRQGDTLDSLEPVASRETDIALDETAEARTKAAVQLLDRLKALGLSHVGN